MARETPAHRRALDAARNAEDRASDKVYRIQRQGAKIRGTDFDPRVGKKNLSDMSTNDLKQHVRNVNRFTSRETQFTPGFAGTPLPRALWREYESQQELHNATTADREAAVGKLTMQGQDATVGEYLGMTTPENLQRQAQSNVSFRIFQQINRRADMVASADDLQKLVDNIKKRNDPGYLAEATGRRSNSIEALLRNSGNQTLIPALRALDPDALDLLLNYSEFRAMAEERFGSGDDELAQVAKDDKAYFERTGRSREVDVRERLEDIFKWVVDNSDVFTAPTDQPAASTDARPTPPAKPTRRRNRNT